MTAHTPYGRLTGTWKVYLAAASTAKPTVTSTPGADWTELGPTEGEQSIQFGGPLVKFYDNDNQGPVKSVRPQEDPSVSFTVVNLTLENYGRIISTLSSVVDLGSSRELPIERGATPTRYALLLKTLTQSPYGLYPDQIYIPIAVNGSEPTETRSKGGSPGLACMFHAEVDSTQAAGKSLGWREAGDA